MFIASINFRLLFCITQQTFLPTSSTVYLVKHLQYLINTKKDDIVKPMINLDG
jgi:hypothetical protein